MEQGLHQRSTENVFEFSSLGENPKDWEVGPKIEKTGIEQDSATCAIRESLPIKRELFATTSIDS